MQQEQARVSVRILEKEYFISCPYEERSALLDAAEFLNARMREIRDSGKVVGLIGDQQISRRFRRDAIQSGMGRDYRNAMRHRLQ